MKTNKSKTGVVRCALVRAERSLLAADRVIKDLDVTAPLHTAMLYLELAMQVEKAKTGKGPQGLQGLKGPK